MVTKKSEVKVVETVNTDQYGLSNETPEWAKTGARGSENVGSKDIVLPRLEIVQSLSPIRDEKPDEAKEGMFFNSATGDVIGDTVIVIPIYYRMEYLIWKDQDSGGGFFGSFDSMREAQIRLNQAVADGEDESELAITDTPVHYCLRLREGGDYEQIVVSMPKSKAKISRKWNAIIQMVGGDRFARAYKLTTFKDKNKQNKTFFNYVVQPAGFPTEAVYREAERLYNVFNSEGVKANHAAAGGGETFSVDSEGGEI